MDIKDLKYQLTIALNDLEYIKQLHSCNDCGKTSYCPHCPREGQQVRINCFAWESQDYRH